MPHPTQTTQLPVETLTRLQAELEAALLSNEARLEQGPQPDDISMAVHRRSREAYDEIVAALSRIEDGSFGTCETCLGSISSVRLEAMPHTRYCVACA